MSRPTAISPEEQEQIARKIGVLLLQSAPDDWQRITVEYRATGEYHDLLAEVTAQDGSSRPWDAPEDLVGTFEHLREGMYRADVGTWLSALYVVERPSSYRIDINFDAEPQWNRPLPRAAYVDELRRYPRAEENVPDWMRAYLTGSGAAPETAHADPVPPEPIPPAPEPVEPAQADAARFDQAVPEQDTDPGRPDAAHPGYDPGPPREPDYDATPPAPPEPATTAVIPSATDDRGAPEAPVAAPPAPAEAPGFRTAMVFDDFDDHGRPMVATRTPVPPEEAAALRQYLESAPIVLASRDNELDQLDTEQSPSVPATWHTDGLWLWPGAVAFYLAQYGVPPEPELVEHIRSRRFTLGEVDDQTREAAVSELLDQPAEHAEETDLDTTAPREPVTARPAEEFAPAEPVDMASRAVPEHAPGPEPVVDEQPSVGGPAPDAPDAESPDVARHEPVAEEPPPEPGPRHVMPEESPIPEEPEEPPHSLALLHDRLAELGVDGDRYRIGSHSTTARCLVQEGPDWVVTADAEGDTDVRFARADQAAAYLLGSLLLSGHTEQVPARPDADVPAPPPETASTAVPGEPLAAEAPEPSAPRPPAAGIPDSAEHAVPETPAAAHSTESPVQSEERPEANPDELPRRVPGARRHGGPDDQQYPEQVGGHFLFNANQGPPPEAPEAAAPSGEEPTRFQPMPRPERPAPPAGPPSPPGGQPAQAPRPGEPARGQAPGAAPGQTPPPLPKRPERGSTGAPQQDPSARPPTQPGPGQHPGQAPDRRANGGMAGPPRQPSAPPGGQQRPQGAQAGPVGRDQQIQPLRGEPPLTLYRDRRHLVLQPGTELDRFGEPAGNVMYAMRTPYNQRSLPPQWASRPYFAYRVQRPVQVLRGTAVPWFEQPGGGTAYVLPAAVSELIADGTLAELPGGENARPPME